MFSANRNLSTMSKENTSIDPDGTVKVVRARSPCKKRSDQKKSKESTVEHQYPVYEHQHALPFKETWIQFNFKNDTEYDSDYDPETRNTFVLIVFSIVFICILITATFNLIVHFTPPLLNFFQSVLAYYICLGCCVGEFVINLAVTCFSYTHYPPSNYIVLFLSVGFYSFITAFATAMSKTTLILYAIFTTMAVVAFLMCLACSPWDFTRFWTIIMVAFLSVAAVSLMCYVGMAITGVKIKPLIIGLTILGTLMQSVVLVLVLQSILGGKTVEMSEDMYIIAAYYVYTSIISIFLKILRLFSMFQSDD